MDIQDILDIQNRWDILDILDIQDILDISDIQDILDIQGIQDILDILDIHGIQAVTLLRHNLKNKWLHTTSDRLGSRPAHN